MRARTTLNAAIMTHVRRLANHRRSCRNARGRGPRHSEGSIRARSSAPRRSLRSESRGGLRDRHARLHLGLSPDGYVSLARLLHRRTQAWGLNSPINQFTHARVLMDDSDTGGQYPNIDTLHSSVWLDLAKEPQILHIPDTKGRYYLVPLVSAYNEIFASIGVDEGLSALMSYAIVGAQWQVLAQDAQQFGRRPTWCGSSFVI